MTDTYTDSKKNDWLKYLKNHYSLYKTPSKKKHSIKRLQSDYRSKLQSRNVDNWL